MADNKLITIEDVQEKRTVRQLDDIITIYVKESDGR